jgi:Ca-activated chloride channel family protein
MEMIRQATRRLVDRLVPNDRVSLVVFSDQSYSLIEDATRDQADQLKAAIDALPTGGSTNLAQGLRCAYAVAQRVPSSEKLVNRVVLLTDGLTAIDGPTAVQIDQRLAEAAASGTRLHVVDLSQEREQEDRDPLLSRLAQKGGGGVHRATSVAQIGWALDEIVTGRSQRVAADAQLHITFNPKAVEVYRLLGHEPRAVVALKTASPDTDFYVGQSATVVCELRLRPNGPNDVATVELTWRDPQNGAAHRINQTIVRGQFAAYLNQAPAPLQAAAMVAEAAEELRGAMPPFNPAWPNPGPLEPVLQLSRQVDPHLLERPSYSAFLALLEKAVAVRPSRGGGDARLRALRDSSK